MLRNKLLSGTVFSLLLIGAADPASASSSVKPPDHPVNAKAAQTDSKKGLPRKEAVVNIVDVTNLRSGPGLDYDIIGKAKPGNSFPVVGSDGDWYKVSLSGGGTAFVAGWVVQIDMPAPAKPPEKAVITKSEPPDPKEPDNKETVVNIVDVTNLRSGPGLDYDIIGKAKPGNTFPVVGSDGDWYKVSLSGGGTAYVAGWVVKTGIAGSPGDSGTISAKDNQQSDTKVYIYHSHNRESWNKVARNVNGTSFDDPEVNITLVGKELGRHLQERGIPSIIEDADFAEKLKEQKLSYAHSYSESRKAVNKAVKAHPSLTYFFDIHRDANVPRDKTTVTIDGKSYAGILFVIGTAHPDYTENKKFAEALNERLNKKYPGLSRGILSKSVHDGNGEYNQDIAPGSLLLEIGGVNNTLEESLLSAEAFAEVFAEYYRS
ncbi:stage II sporulation protein P [Paenibacillus mesophilus]|uniref:stage II sporulation protein P n=1 Tax=Paenibacillus mesophilus TaxID=2582849 RepID=UPI00110D6A0C|nr:stage II sporulation protein P [Paenibacillus mesophilus]TMV50150.1 stage II sporulation protein P [Paenibacillus mesophilus]